MNLPRISVNPQLEDCYWRVACPLENYFHKDMDYEDYAPAYCAGYVGYAQYGGRYEDSEASLCANWERIKGDSRLTLGDALMAMRAAWSRMEMKACEAAEAECAPVLPGVRKSMQTAAMAIA